MHNVFGSGLNVFQWAAALPALGRLVKDAKEAWTDHHLTPEEIQKIGSDFIAIVVSLGS